MLSIILAKEVRKISFYYLGNSYISLNDFLQGKEKKHLYDLENHPIYEFPIENDIKERFNSKDIKSKILGLKDLLITIVYGDIMARGSIENGKNLSDINSNLISCSDILQMPTPYALIDQKPKWANSESITNVKSETYAVALGTEESQFIIVNEKLFKTLTEKECSFILGSQCGCISANYTLYKTLCYVLLISKDEVLKQQNKVLLEMLLKWHKYAVITTDRAALLCCRNLKIAEGCLEKMSNQKCVPTLLSTNTRFKALKLYSQSQQYYDVVGLEYSKENHLLKIGEVNAMVKDFI